MSEPNDLMPSSRTVPLPLVGNLGLTISAPPGFWQEMLIRFQKAVDHPDSLTDEERRYILDRPPADEENRLCRDYTGLDHDELIQKALSHPDALTDDEARCITSPLEKPRWEKAEFRPAVWLGLPPEGQKLRWEAVKAATTPTEELAKANAYGVRNVRVDTDSLLAKDDRKNIGVVSGHIPWVRDIVASLQRQQQQQQQQQEPPQWGFVLFRTSFKHQDVWQRFTQELKKAADTALARASWTDRIRQKWRVQYVEDTALDGADVARLRERFRDMCSGGSGEGARILPGLRRDVFLFVDEEALTHAMHNSPLPARGWVRAADPAFEDDGSTSTISGTSSSSLSPSSAPDADSTKQDFEGTINVGLTHVFTTFYARLAPGADMTLCDERRKDMKQSWEAMHRQSLRSYGTAAPEYPPRQRPDCTCFTWRFRSGEGFVIYDWQAR